MCLKLLSISGRSLWLLTPAVNKPTYPTAVTATCPKCHFFHQIQSYLSCGSRTYLSPFSPFEYCKQTNVRCCSRSCRRDADERLAESRRVSSSDSHRPAEPDVPLQTQPTTASVTLHWPTAAAGDVSWIFMKFSSSLFTGIREFRENLLNRSRN